MNLRIVLLGIAAVTMLSGCGQSATDARLTYERGQLRQECFGSDTNDCRSKTIDFNLSVINSRDYKSDVDKNASVMMFGSDSWAIYQTAADEVVDGLTKKLESLRPGFFARWFLGDHQPQNGPSVYEMSPSDITTIEKQILLKYIAKAKAAGMNPSPQLLAKLQAADPNQAFSDDPSVTKPNVAPVAPMQEPEEKPAPAPLAIPSTAAAPQSVARETTERASAEISPELDQVIKTLIDSTATDGGVEYVEGREVLDIDLNGDGQQDALVMFTIEGEGGAQRGYQTLAALYHEQGGWKFQGKTFLKGSAAGLSQAGPNLVNVTALTLGPDDADCCPSVEVPQQYKWVGNHFVETVQPAK